MKKRILSGLVLFLSVCMIGCAVMYVRAFYPAQDAALACLASLREGVCVEHRSDGWAFVPQEVSAGLVFYPGGNVAAESYAPLMEALAARGILGVLLKMPASLAILDMDAAEGIQAAYPAVQRWYIGGHSLGGYAASTYLGDAHEKYEGLILLAAYTQTDLTDTKLDVLSIYGSEDGVLSRERYQAGLPLLPEGYEELIIDGGCHSYFGAYGMQSGDGVPAVTREEQIAITADAVAAFMD